MVAVGRDQSMPYWPVYGGLKFHKMYIINEKKEQINVIIVTVWSSGAFATNYAQNATASLR